MLLISKQIIDKLVLLYCLITLGGCTVLGPDYSEPDVTWIDNWQSSLFDQDAAAEQQEQTDLRFWWNLFDDPVLNALIITARQQNPSLKIAGLRILESRAALGIARGNTYPQLQQAIGATTYLNTSQHGGANDVSQDLISYQVGFNLSWELDFWGRFRRGIESADAVFFSSISNQRDVQVLLNAQVADLYFSYITAVLRLDVARKNAEIQKRSYDITESRYQSGQDTELDLQQAKTQYLVTLGTIPALEITLTKIRNSFCALLGRAPGNLPELTTPTSGLPSVDPLVLKSIKPHQILRRPDVRAAAWQIAAQSAQIGIAEADLYPAISILGGMSWSGNTLGGTPDTTTLNAGPSFTWNLFNYGRIKNNVRIQDAKLQQAIESYQDMVLQAAREVDDAAVTVIKTREQKKPLEASVEAAQRSLKLSTTLYREGYADFQRVLDAQRAVATQMERKLINDGDHIRAIVTLYKSLGGGWIDTPIEELVPDSVRSTMENRTDWGELLRASVAEPPPSADSSLENNEYE